MNNHEKKSTVQGASEGKKPAKSGKLLKVELGILLGVVIVYVGLGIFFQSHFCFGTTIDDIDVGGKSVAQAEELLRAETKTYVLELTEREGKSEQITGESISLSLEINDGVLNLLKEQNGFLWGILVFKQPKLELGAGLVYDEEALTKVVQTLEAMQPSNQREPVNAECSEYSSQGYALVAADYGTTIKEEALLSAIKEAVVSLEASIDLSEAGCYADPEIGDDNEKLLEAIEQLNQYVATKIVYDFVEEEEILDGEVISTWLSIDDDLEIVVDEDAVLAFVKSLASEYNTAYKAKTLMTSYGKEVTISSSTYGWRIDNAGEVAQILQDIQEGTTIEREPVYLQCANSHGENDYGDSYVEINLTAQHLFLYKDGELITESDFVSGCPAKGNATPTGVFGLTYKTKNAVLRGDDYATPVNYWMPFNGNIGMHDLTSRRAFGGDIYKTNGSHGCINLPLSAAETIYETISDNYPVLVYTLPGTESPAVKQKEIAAIISEIDIIGPVTLLSEPVIIDARTRYDALDSASKQQITNYQTLVDAEAALAQLKAETAAQTTP